MNIFLLSAHYTHFRKYIHPSENRNSYRPLLLCRSRTTRQSNGGGSEMVRLHAMKKLHSGGFKILDRVIVYT